MSTEAAQRREPARSRAAQQALRIGFGTATGYTLACALGWPAALLAPILFLQLAATLPVCPGPGLALRTLAAMSVCVGIGWLLTFTIIIPPLCVLLIGILLFFAFYAQAAGIGGLAPFLLMLATCLLPVLAVQAPELASRIAFELVRATAVAFVLLWLTWAAFPDPATPRPSGAAGSRSQPAPPPADAPARIALLNTLLVMPVVLVFLLLNITSAIVALLTTLIIVRAQTSAVQRGISSGVMRANLLAGTVTVAGTAVILAVPSLPMVFLVVLLVALLFAQRITTAGPSAAVMLVPALTATVALLDGALSSFSAGATAAAWSRITAVALAILYVTATLHLTARWRRRRLHE